MVKDNPAVLSEEMGAECQWLQKKYKNQILRAAFQCSFNFSSILSLDWALFLKQEP